MQVEDLEEHWKEIASSIDSARVRTFPATINQPAGIAQWPNEEPFSEFLAHAIDLGVRLLYVGRAVFDQEALTDLQAKVAGDEAQAGYRPAMLMPADSETSITFPELDRFISHARSLLGRIWAIEVQWVDGSIVHSYFKVAKWYSEMLDKLPGLRAQLSQIEVSRDAEALSRHEAELDKAARSIASSPDFRRSKKTLAAIRRLAAKALPEAPLSDLHQVARSALEVYESDSLPEEERQLAQRARLLVNDGLSLTKGSCQPRHVNESSPATNGEVRGLAKLSRRLTRRQTV